MPRLRRIGPDEIELGRIGYCDLARDPHEVAAALEIHISTLYSWARKYRWPPRRIRRQSGIRPDFVLPDPAGIASAGVAGQLARLERLASQSIAALEGAAASGQATDPERVARALATHVRTQAQLNKLQSERHEEPADADEPPPRTLAELRDELREHFARIQDEEEG